MTEFKIVPARLHHCGQMSRTLRIEQAEAFARAGIDVHREMRRAYRESTVALSWLIDGRLAAMGGVLGSLAESTVFVWVAASRLAAQYPIAFAREAKRQLDKVAAPRTMLVTTLMPDDEASLRFAVFMGFHTEASGTGRQVFSRASRADLVKAIRDDPEIRIPLGDRYAMAVAYRPEVNR